MSVNEEVARHRQELAAETAVYALSVEMESAAQRIAGESKEVRAFFESEIHAFEKMRKTGNDAKANRSYVTATNFFVQAKAKADALKQLVTARGNCLVAKERAEAAKRLADEVGAKSTLALRYEEADKALGEVEAFVVKRDFVAASARAESARGQFASLRTDVIKVALDESGRNKVSERWEKCLAAAEKVLGWEPQNAAAAALKSEAESHLQSLRIVAKIGDREVPAIVENNLFGKNSFHFHFGEDTFDQFEQMMRGKGRTPKKEVKRKDVLPVNLRISFDVKVYSQNSRGQPDLFGRKIERRAANGETNITCWIERDKDNMYRSFGFLSSGLTFCFPREDLKVEYVENGKLYQGVLKSNSICVGTRKDATVDLAWTGLKTVTVCLTECVNKCPKPGEMQTVTLPGGVPMTFCWCPATTSEEWKRLSGGEDYFWMGSPEGELGRKDDETRHRVKLTKGFWMAQTPVTQRQYEAVTGKNPTKFGREPFAPVSNVTWTDCCEFCRLLVVKLGDGSRFALPTEAQWEYACRAGTTTALNNGKDLTTKDGACPNLNEVAWYWENEDHQRKSVMGKRGNAWNLYDMHGNTWEWCSDYYGDYGEDLQVDPTGAASGSRRVHRGGSGYSHAQGCRSAFRDNESEDYSHYWLSFRPVRILSD